MEIRFLIVGAPFLITFFYSLFWLKRWNAFNSPNNNFQKIMNRKDQSMERIYILGSIFSKKN